MKLSASVIIIFTILLTMCKNVFAQKELPVDEREVFYLYQEFGVSSENKVKIVVVSSHLYRYKYNDNSHSRIQTELTLAFNNKMNAITGNEYASGQASYHQVAPTGAADLEFAFSNHGIASATGPETYLTVKSPSQLLVKSRELTLSNFEKSGYSVFQADFEEYIDFTSLGLEKIERLSPLWITPYRKGLLLSIAQSYQKRPGGASSGITVRETESKSTSKTSTPKKEDNTDWEAITNAKRWEAGSFETEGDRLMKLGHLSEAADNYRKAQAAFYTDRVQQKLDNSEGTLKAGAVAIGGALDLASDVSYSFDRMNIPKFSAWGITHNGLAPDDRNKGVAPDLIPSATYLTYGGYRIIAMEVGASFVRSPVYTMFLKDDSDRRLDQTIQVNRATIGYTASVGLAIPFKHFVVYGMYGVNLPLFITEANMLTSGYTYKDIKDDLHNITLEPKADVGIKIKIPGTRIGIGAHYAMTKNIGKNIKLKQDGYSEVSHGSKKYLVGGSVHESYKYEVIGFSLYYLTKR